MATTRVLFESLDSMDEFLNSSVNFDEELDVNDYDSIWVDVNGAIDNFNLETDVDTFLRNTFGNTRNDYRNNSEFEAVKLSNITTLENCQHQTESSVHINLEDDECVNYNTPSTSSVSDIAAADATFLPLTRCFSDFEEPFVEFVYPKGDPDAVCLTKRDIDLLQPDTYINDTIIDFYILFLKNKLQEQEKARFHFFNSFFFPKLAGIDKTAPYACDGKSAFQSVRKWSRKVNLFEKDYIFIPVNFNRHWSLIVICHPGEVVNINDTEPEKSLRLPCILHMDSVRGYHSGLKELVQSYLLEEWNERKKDTCGEDLSSRFMNMRFLSVEVPQQENSYDCGLFLLHYLELFLAEAPFDFNPLRITKFSNFLNWNWFPPAEAYLKRSLISWLIFELMESHGSQEGVSPNNGDDDCLSSVSTMEVPLPTMMESRGSQEGFSPNNGDDCLCSVSTMEVPLPTMMESHGSQEGFSPNNGDDCLCSESTMEIDTDYLQAEPAELYTSGSYPMSVENIQHYLQNVFSQIDDFLQAEPAELYTSRSYPMSVENIQRYLQNI